MSKARVTLIRSQAVQDSRYDRVDDPSRLRVVMDVSEDQFQALKTYIKAIQDGTDTSAVETAITNL